mmetsp:Transcript_114640/g.331306  ORF Transcript_114640/g.331306 Transcript_114640/m.331306 type:complete len:323 (+) Transcript_114640:393-1361(+)
MRGLRTTRAAPCVAPCRTPAWCAGLSVFFTTRRRTLGRTSMEARRCWVVAWMLGMSSKTTSWSIAVCRLKTVCTERGAKLEGTRVFLCFWEAAEVPKERVAGRQHGKAKFRALAERSLRRARSGFTMTRRPTQARTSTEGPLWWVAVCRRTPGMTTCGSWSLASTYRTMPCTGGRTPSRRCRRTHPSPLRMSSRWRRGCPRSRRSPSVRYRSECSCSSSSSRSSKWGRCAPSPRPPSCNPTTRCRATRCSSRWGRSPARRRPMPRPDPAHECSHARFWHSSSSRSSSRRSKSSTHCRSMWPRRRAASWRSRRRRASRLPQRW